MKGVLRTVVAVVCACFFALTSRSATIHVPADQPTIQAGIDAAVNGDTVLIAPGTYTGEGNWNIDYHGKGIVIYGEGTPGDARVAITYDYPAPRRRGFIFHSGEDSTAVLYGIMISGEVATVGGAIRCDSGSSPKIQECLFIGNSGAGCGAAIGVFGGSEPRIAHCTFNENLARGYYYPTMMTGTVSCENASVTIEDCTFRANWARYGGAVAASNGTVSARRCRFELNRAQEYYWGQQYGGDGGAICLINSQGEFDSCLFLNNIAPIGYDDMANRMGGTGGVSAIRGSECLFRSCTFVGNITESFTGPKAGAFYADSSNVSLEKCIVAFNDSYSTTFIDGDGQGLFTITNTDVFGNLGGDWAGAASGQLGIRGNISADPLFCDTATDNFDLHYESPAIRGAGMSPIIWGALTVGCCACQKVGNVDCDPSNMVDIADITALVDYLYMSLSSPCCDTQADIDGVPGVDISDVTTLVDNLYISLTPIRLCQ